MSERPYKCPVCKRDFPKEDDLIWESKWTAPLLGEHTEAMLEAMGIGFDVAVSCKLCKKETP